MPQAAAWNTFEEHLRKQRLDANFFIGFFTRNHKKYHLLALTQIYAVTAHPFGARRFLPIAASWSSAPCRVHEAVNSVFQKLLKHKKLYVSENYVVFDIP